MTAHFDHDAGPAPCDTCELAERCASRFLACQAFWHYCRLERWHGAPREPTRERYTAIYQPRIVDEAVLARLREMKRQTKAERGTRDGRRPRGPDMKPSYPYPQATESISESPARVAVVC